MSSLASLYRPHKFEDVVSQTSIIKILSQQIETGEISNCMLFAGPSGCGKTTTARIFALKLNEYIDAGGNVCSSDPIEIDGASNNGVDNVRDIIRNANERSLDGKYKIFIIDECHSLTNQAWQAFLKCIEEPPKYTVFIFCTTDPQKIPSTILNRVMRFNFTRINSQDIKQRLLYICNEQQFTNYEETCDYISRISNCQMRDAIANLEKCARYSSDLNIQNCLTSLGDCSYETMFELMDGILSYNTEKMISVIENVYNSGMDLRLFINSFFGFVVDIQKYIIFQDINVTKLPAIYNENVKFITNFNDASYFYKKYIDALLDLKIILKTDNDPKNTIEAVLLLELNKWKSYVCNII